MLWLALHLDSTALDCRWCGLGSEVPHVEGPSPKHPDRQKQRTYFCWSQEPCERHRMPYGKQKISLCQNQYV